MATNLRLRADISTWSAFRVHTSRNECGTGKSIMNIMIGPWRRQGVGMSGVFHIPSTPQTRQRKNDNIGLDFTLFSQKLSAALFITFCSGTRSQHLLEYCQNNLITHLSTCAVLRDEPISETDLFCTQQLCMHQHPLRQLTQQHNPEPKPRSLYAGSYPDTAASMSPS